MAIQFPSNPNLLDTVTQAGITYQWNGASWEVVPEAISYNDIADGVITLGDSTIQSIANQGITIESDGLYISGSKLNSLEHAGSIIPTHLDDITDIVEYLAFNQSLMSDINENVESFDEGIRGVSLSTQHSIYVSSRTGGVASCTNGSTFGENDTALIEATALNGYVFDRWESDSDIADDSLASTSVTMTSDKFIVAYFKKN